jgi:hypothetical protein
MTEQDKKEVQFILKTAKQIAIGFAIIISITFLIITVWKE